MDEEDPQLIVLVGLPASGKSTWAYRYIREHPEAVRVCRDNLREMLHFYTSFEPWRTAANRATLENLVTELVGTITDAMLRLRLDLIIDETNLQADKRQYWRTRAAAHGYDYVEVLLSEAVEVCVQRDAARPVRPVDHPPSGWQVGEAVIRSMAVAMNLPIGR